MLPADSLIQHEYPKPIAAVFSKAINTLDGSSRIDQFLKVVETATQYLAISGFARLRATHGIDETLKRSLSPLLRKPTFGMWLEGVRHLDSSFSSHGESLAGVPLNEKRTDLEASRDLLQASTPGHQSGKLRLNDVLAEYVRLRNAKQHQLPFPRQLERDPDLLGRAVKELLQALPALHRYLLVHARMVSPRRKDYEVRLVTFSGDGGPKPLSEIRALPHKLIQGYLYLYEPGSSLFVEISPFLQAEYDDILCFAGLDRAGEPIFVCPYVSMDASNLEDARQDLHDCVPFLFERADTSVEQLRPFVEFAAADGVIHRSELELLRSRALELGIAADPKAAEETVKAALAAFGVGVDLTATAYPEVTPPDAAETAPALTSARAIHQRSAPATEPASTDATGETPPPYSASAVPAAATHRTPTVQPRGAEPPPGLPRKQPTVDSPAPPRKSPLPPRPHHCIVGREPLIESLRNRLFEGGSLALTGHPGVGKTAVALELAHDPLTADHFSRSLLWVELGPHPDLFGLLGQVADRLEIPATVLADLSTIEDRIRAINMAIGSRPFLIVIDDAWSEGDALAFRFSSERATHLLTTHQLPVAHAFATVAPETIRGLSLADGLSLLEQFLPGISENEARGAQQLVEMVSGLPLALVLIGHHLKIRTRGRPRSLLKSEIEKLLRESRQRLALTHREDRLSAEQSLNAVAHTSVQSLSPEAAHALYQLCVLPPKPSTFSEPAALTVSGASAEALYALVDSGLLEFLDPDRYALNRVIVDYATATRDASSLADAQQRMAEYYVSFLRAHIHDSGLIDPEYHNVLESLHVAATQELGSLFVDGANAFRPTLERRGQFGLALELLTRAMSFAESFGDGVRLMRTLLNLGAITYFRSSYTDAEHLLLRGLQLARDTGDDSAVMQFCHWLGKVSVALNKFGEGNPFFQEALRLARERGEHRHVLDILSSLGEMEDVRGNYETAEHYFRDGLRLVRRPADDDRYRSLLLHLGWVIAHLGDLAQAEQIWNEALDLARQMRHQPDLALALAEIGWVCDRLGNSDAADAYLSEGIALTRSIGHVTVLTKLLTNHGAALLHRGDLSNARSTIIEGLDVIKDTHGFLRGILLENLGMIECRQDNLDAAEQHYREALALASCGTEERTCAAKTFLGEVALERGDLTLAEELLQASLTASRQIRNLERVAVAERLMGRLYQVRGDHEQARSFFDSALANARRLGYRWLLGRLHADLGFLLSTHDLPLASQHFREAHTISDEIGSRELRGLSLFGDAQCSAAAGDRSRALSLGTEGLAELDLCGVQVAADVRAWLAGL